MITRALILLFTINVCLAKQAELLVDLHEQGLSKVKGVLQEHGIELYGKAKITPVPGSEDRLMEILWTDIKKGKETSKLKTPLTSSIAAITLKKGKKIDIDGDFSQLGKTVASVNSPREVLLVKKKAPKAVGKLKKKDISIQPDMHINESDDYLANDKHEYRKEPSPTSSEPRQYSLNVGGRYNERDKLPVIEKLASGETPSVSKTLTDEAVRVDITSEGCKPRIDYANDRVTIQNKSITWQGDKKVKETECMDSLENYTIKRDYNCAACQDKIDLDAGFAYPVYESYWTNKVGERQVLTSQPEVDKEQQYPIVAEKGNCEPLVDLEAMEVFPKIELVYRNRVNARVVAKECHKDLESAGASISETTDSCTPTHDFENNWSILQKMGIFALDGRNYTAFDCREVGHPIRHEFDTGVCPMNIDLDDGQVAIMGKRCLEIEGVKHYLSDCEPVGREHRLQLTREGCEGEYTHSLDEGRSYLQKRWFYYDGVDKQFVTGCIKSIEHLPHKFATTSFEHDDVSKTSKRVVTVYIEDGDSCKDIIENHVSKKIVPVPYALKDTKDEPSEDSRYDGCYKVAQTNRYQYWERPDQSVFKLLTGIGKPHRGENECRTDTEIRYVYTHTKVTESSERYARAQERNENDPNGKLKNHTRTEYWTEGYHVGNSYRQREHSYTVTVTCQRYHKKQIRTVTIYPNDTKAYGEWRNDGGLVVR